MRRNATLKGRRVKKKEKKEKEMKKRQKKKGRKPYHVEYAEVITECD